MADTVNIHQAKTHFSQLIERVQAGEEIIVAKAGRPVARLVPIGPLVRQLGARAGKMWMADDFDAPLPEDFLIGGAL